MSKTKMNANICMEKILDDYNHNCICFDETIDVSVGERKWGHQDFPILALADVTACLSVINMSIYQEDYIDMLEDKISKLEKEMRGKIMNNIENLNTIEVPLFIYDWLNKEYKNWNFRSEKCKGEFVFRVVQDLIKYQNDEKTWGDFEINDDVVIWVKNNEFDFIKAIIDGCYPTLGEMKQ